MGQVEFPLEPAGATWKCGVHGGSAGGLSFLHTMFDTIRYDTMLTER